MKNGTLRRWSQTVSTVKNSVARIWWVLAHELPPAGPGSKGRRRQAVAAKDNANGLVGAAHAEFGQFALNPTVSPAGVLASQAQDELAVLGDQTWTAAPGAACEQGRIARDEIAMPAQQGLGADEEANQVGRAGAGRDRRAGGDQPAASAAASPGPGGRRARAGGSGAPAGGRRPGDVDRPGPRGVGGRSRRGGREARSVIVAGAPELPSPVPRRCSVGSFLTGHPLALVQPGMYSDSIPIRSFRSG